MDWDINCCDAISPQQLRVCSHKSIEISQLDGSCLMGSDVGDRIEAENELNHRSDHFRVDQRGESDKDPGERDSVSRPRLHFERHRADHRQKIVLLQRKSFADHTLHRLADAQQRIQRYDGDQKYCINVRDLQQDLVCPFVISHLIRCNESAIAPSRDTTKKLITPNLTCSGVWVEILRYFLEGITLERENPSLNLRADCAHENDERVELLRGIELRFVHHKHHLIVKLLYQLEKARLLSEGKVQTIGWSDGNVNKISPIRTRMDLIFPAFFGAT